VRNWNANGITMNCDCILPNLFIGPDPRVDEELVIEWKLVTPK